MGLPILSHEENEGFRYRPARKTYLPGGEAVVVEMVRDGEVLNKHFEEQFKSGLLVPQAVQERAKKEGWMMSDPIVRVVAVGPDVKDPRLKSGVVLVVPKGVARSAPKVVYRGAGRWPDDADLVFVINVTNVAFIVPDDEAELIMQQARASGVRFDS